MHRNLGFDNFAAEQPPSATAECGARWCRGASAGILLRWVTKRWQLWVETVKNWQNKIFTSDSNGPKTLCYKSPQWQVKLGRLGPEPKIPDLFLK